MEPWQQIEFVSVLNLVVCCFAVIVGLVLYRKYRPPKFSDHGYMQWAFWFLVARWMALTVAYLTLIVSPDSNKVMLGFVDTTSVCDMAFAWILVQGDEFSSTRTLYAFGGFCAFLLCWNLGFSPQNSNWAAASNAFSAFTTPLVAFAFLLRLRGAASSILFLMALGYSIAQLHVSAALQVSQSVFTGFERVLGYLLGLALGKILVGGLGYALFFAPVEGYEIATTKITQSATDAVKSAVKKALIVGLVNLIFAILAAILVTYFWPVVHATPPR